MQCGVASLAMATGFLGVPYGIDDLARICYVTREGVSMLTLSRAADRLGLKATTVKVTADRLRHLPMPAILHWNNNHFVLLYGITRKGNFRIADPAKGHMTLSEGELVSHWLRGNSEAPGKEAKGIAMILDTFSGNNCYGVARLASMTRDRAIRPPISGAQQLSNIRRFSGFAIFC